MTRHRLRHQWNQTAEILAVTINAHRDPRKCGPVRAEQLNPFDRQAPAAAHQVSAAEGISLAKSAFVPGASHGQK